MSVPVEAEHEARRRTVTVEIDGPDLDPASAEAQIAWVLARARKHVTDSQARIVMRALPRFYDQVKRLPLNDLGRTTFEEDAGIALLLTQLVADVLHEAAQQLDNRLALDLAANLALNPNQGVRTP